MQSQSGQPKVDLAPGIFGRHAYIGSRRGNAAERKDHVLPPGIQLAMGLILPQEVIARKRAAVILPVYPRRSGYVRKIDTRALGYCVVRLGGGRSDANARIDPSVGLSEIARIGAFAGDDTPLCLVHARDAGAAAAAAEKIAAAYEIADEAANQPRPCIIARTGPDGL